MKLFEDILASLNEEVEVGYSDMRNFEYKKTKI